MDSIPPSIPQLNDGPVPTVGADEKNRLMASIRASHTGRVPVDLSQDYDSDQHPNGTEDFTRQQIFNSNGVDFAEGGIGSGSDIVGAAAKASTTRGGGGSTIDASGIVARSLLEKGGQPLAPAAVIQSATSTGKRTPPPKPRKSSHLTAQARDKRDEVFPPSVDPSPPGSPFTANPPVDYDGLSWPSKGTRSRLDATPEQAEANLQKLQGAVRTILECIGEDPEREGLRGTPERYAKAMLYFTKGYEENVLDLVNGAVFHEDHDELVIVKDIDVFSLCEHHMVPFTGKMHIGYLPNRRVIGLSKLARLAEMFSRRLQVQERLTKQVALAIAEILKPRGVAVVMESSHLCMVMRGVSKTNSSTTTSCMLGILRKSAKTREEFLNLLHRR